MPPTEPLLSLIAAAALRPPQTTRVDAWLTAIEYERAAGARQSYRDLVALQFRELGVDPHYLTSRTAVVAAGALDLAFADAAEVSQSELARAAAAALVALPGVNPDLAGLLIYLHTAVDADIFQSTVSRIAAERGWSRVPHFSVSQLQDAAVYQALDIAGGFFRVQPSLTAAALVAAEQWPLHYPRVLPCGTVLGDGAAALWLLRPGASLPLPRLDLYSSQVQCRDDFDPVFGPVTLAGTAHRRQALCDVAASLLDHARLPASAIAGFFGPGLGDDIDHAIASALGLADTAVAEPDAGTSASGHLLCARTPTALADCLAQLRTGDGRWGNGAWLLFCGLGHAGSAGAALFQVRT